MNNRTKALVSLFAGGAIMLASTGTAAADVLTGATPIPGVDYVVDFEVVDETYRVLVTDDKVIQDAFDLLNGKTLDAVPVGLVKYGKPGVNVGWSWQIDPDSFHFGSNSVEVCDGLPSDVERHLITSDHYCPWSAVVVRITPVR
ncbi:BP74-related protein [Actinokineospora sp. HUAS TT18]|uniref:BP74-related protein n=1 Tax=Actinokineospora sp. HUAS TT18 TaxID=3447451 RepID=UPI003F5267B6